MKTYFMQAPSRYHQQKIYINGEPYLSGLSVNQGPVSFPMINNNNNPKNSWERKNAICYPTTHSIPGPYLQNYISLI